LYGLGFSAEQVEQPYRSFSGGWRIRLNLAQALMSPAELLLLDEPTNHLDLEAILWLESWLRHYPGALLIIAHDRTFLDHTVDHVLHLSGEQAHFYKGNYSAFERLRSEVLERQQAMAVKQQAPGGAYSTVCRSLPRQGEQGQASTKPNQGTGKDAHAGHAARRFRLSGELC
jgi:ATP-binding cassette subfamily F protein 3